MSTLLSSWFNSPIQQNQNVLTKFISHNNTPVNQFCQSIPITQPSFISTTFGQSMVSFAVLVIYYSLYRRETNRTGVEDRLLASLILGNLVFSLLAFNDYFNLNYAIINCNDYKNGAINLYTVSQAIESFTLANVIEANVLDMYENFFEYFWNFVHALQGSFVSFAERLNHVLTYGYIDLIQKL